MGRLHGGVYESRAIVSILPHIKGQLRSKVSKRRLTDTKKNETKRMISRANCNTMFLFFLTADCFNTLTNVLKRAALIGDVNTTYDRDFIRYKSTNLH